MFYSNRSDQLCLFLICSLVSFPDQCSLRAVNISLIVSYEYRVKEQFFGPFATVPLWLDTRLHVHRVRVGQHGYKIDRRLKEYTCMYGPDLQFFK